MSGGEFARAVLTENCKKSRPIFYTLAATLDPQPNLGLMAYGTIQTKADSWFLCTAITTIVSRSTGTNTQKNSALFQLIRQRDSYKFFQYPQFEGANGFNLSRQTDLEDYPLMEPSDTLELQVTGQGPSFVVTPAYCFLIMSGIEYYV